MAIVVNEKTGFFSIRTANTEYQMKADKYGVLKHLWYGAPVESDMDYLLEYPDVGFAGNIYEAGNDRTYSLNTMPFGIFRSRCGGFPYKCSISGLS